MSHSTTQVDFFPHQAHCYAFGGFEIQMRDAAIAVRSTGINVKLRDSWDFSAAAPIVHHWGMGYSHIENIIWAKQSGQKVVLTVLLPYLPSTYSRVRGWVGRLISKGRIDRRSLLMADKVVVVNDLQAEIAHVCYGVPRNNVAIIPNIVSSSFFENANSSLMSNYWVIAGSICRRKNQLNAAKAAVKAGIKLVIVGHALPGEARYANELGDFANMHSSLITCLPGMDRDSPEYIRLLRNAKGLLLPSRMEQQPIIALEMGVLQKPVILGDVDYAYQASFIGAALAPTESVNAIAEVLRQIDKGNSQGYLRADMKQFSESAVGSSYADIYLSLSGGIPPMQANGSSRRI